MVGLTGGGFASILHVSGDKMYEVHVIEDKHREEVAALKKKLQWFTENQELLDRDACRLKAATGEIQQLKEQVGFCSCMQNKIYTAFFVLCLWDVHYPTV